MRILLVTLARECVQKNIKGVETDRDGDVSSVRVSVRNTKGVEKSTPQPNYSTVTE